MIELNKIYNEDCLAGMKNIPDKSIDLILQDPPYNSTACKWEWDIMEKITEFWAEWKRIIKDNGTIVMMANQPFTSKIIVSNLEMFKYCWTWKKNFPTGFALAKYQPMRVIEDICVFSNGKTIFNKQMISCSDSVKKRWKDKEEMNLPSQVGFKVETIGMKTQKHKINHLINPINFLDIKAVNHSAGTLHPTQKPVQLFEYLIKTYTNEDNTVYDGFMGSGTTAIACINTKRNYIGFELDKKYFDIAEKRIQEYKKQEEFKFD